MANATWLQKKNGQYLWFSLLGLGFNPETAASSIPGKASMKHLNIGPSMFDKPNKDAFYIVTRFLLGKLNPARFNETYRHCWPVLDHKADAEFRKITCTWLKEIMDETANAGSKVMASLFLSPGGPKFTSLMLHVTHHVMLQEMKTFTADDWVPVAAAIPTSSLDMAVKRLNLIHTRFHRAALDQDRFLQEYQKRAQLLVTSVRELIAEGAKYDELNRQNSDFTLDEAALTEKAKRVEFLWAVIEEMLESIRQGRSVVDGVLSGDVDKYVLDGTGQSLTVPRCLLEKIEKLPHQLTSGNLYEDGKLNLLCVMELTNYSLQLLKEERSRVSQISKPELCPQQLEEKCEQMARVLQDLRLLRVKVSKEEIPQLRCAITRLESEWDRRWTDTLKVTPLVSFLNNDPTLSFLSPMAPLSFEPCGETSYIGSVFSQYAAKLPEDKTGECEAKELVSPTATNCLRPNDTMVEVSGSPTVAPRVSSANTSLDWLFDTSPPPVMPPQKVPVVLPTQASESRNNRSKVAPMKTQSQILDLECDNLADQFADAVTADGGDKGLDLGTLLTTLSKDPFSTRKQLPRTPESLINDVKSSWRKAVEEDKVKKSSLLSEQSDSITGQISPLHETTTCTSPLSTIVQNNLPVSQQGVLFKSTLLWDTFSEAHDSPSGTGSSAMQFSIDHETLPELPSLDSLDGMDEELLIPMFPTKSKQPVFSSSYTSHIKSESSRDARTESCLMSGTSLDQDWLVDSAISEEKMEKRFSLGLDSLQTPSPSKDECDLPKLITFSPIIETKSQSNPR